MIEEMFEFVLEESRQRNQRMSKDRRRSGARVETEGFRCKQCGAFVVRNPLFSGVINRNHCPYCLWSRHVDWKQAGDRMSVCKGKMRPIGLTLKREHKKYAVSGHELMLIHACEDCGHISINRIAADDSPDALLAVFESSAQLEESTCSALRTAQIARLETDQISLVSRLLGMM